MALFLPICAIIGDSHSDFSMSLVISQVNLRRIAGQRLLSLQTLSSFSPFEVNVDSICLSSLTSCIQRN